jgi:hypothetical protein
MDKLTVTIRPSKSLLNMELLLMKKQIEQSSDVKIKIFHYFLFKINVSSRLFWVKINQRDMKFLVLENKKLIQSFSTLIELKKWIVSLTEGVEKHD